jgi:hypothetical protein
LVVTIDRRMAGGASSGRTFTSTGAHCCVCRRLHGPAIGVGDEDAALECWQTSGYLEWHRGHRISKGREPHVTNSITSARVAVACAFARTLQRFPCCKRIVRRMNLVHNTLMGSVANFRLAPTGRMIGGNGSGGGTAG